MLKTTKCDICREDFTSRYENLILVGSDAELVNIKSRGGLIHPNLHLVRLFQRIEYYFQKDLDSPNIYHLVVQYVIISGKPLTFPCRDHKEKVISYCIHYYNLYNVYIIVEILFATGIISCSYYNLFYIHFYYILILSGILKILMLNHCITLEIITFWSGESLRGN